MFKNLIGLAALLVIGYQYMGADPTASIRPLLQEAKDARTQGNLDKAAQLYSQALELSPDHEASYNNRGLVYENQGKHELALKDIQKALELNPDYKSAYTNLGKVYLSMNQLDKADTALNKAIELDFQSAQAHLMLGMSQIMQGDLEAGITHTQTAIDLDISEKDIAYTNLAAAYLNNGNAELALRTSTLAIKANPNYPNSYYVRGMGFKVQNNCHAAKIDFQKSCALSFSKACSETCS